MARSLLLALVLACAFTSALGQRTVSGAVYRHPRDRRETVNTFVKLDKSNSITSLGIRYTKGFLEKLNSLPITFNFPVPLTATFSFNLTQHNILLDVPQVGGQPFKVFRANHYFNGAPAPLPGEAGLKPWTVPFWDFHMYFDPKFYYYSGKQPNVWTVPTTYGHPFCQFTTPELVRRSFAPIATECYPQSPTLLNVGLIQWGHGNHLAELSGAEFNPPQPFNYSTVYGSFDGQIEFIEPAYANSYLLKATTTPICAPMPKIPAMQTARKMPSRWCLKREGNNIVVEFLDWYNIPKAECKIKADGSNADPRSFTPGELKALLLPECQEGVTFRPVQGGK